MVILQVDWCGMKTQAGKTPDRWRSGFSKVEMWLVWFENTKDVIGGTWTEYIYTSTWTHPNAFVGTGDMNQDGRVDIVSVSR